MQRTTTPNTIGNSPKVPRAKFLRSDGIFCFVELCKFGSFKNPFATITNLSGFYFKFGRFIVGTNEKLSSMNYDSCTNSWKPWRRGGFDLILTMKDIYINSNLNPLTKFTSSSRSIEFKDIRPWSISQMITKTIPISMTKVISYVMKRGIPLWIWWKIYGDWDNNMIRISQWRESHCRTNTSVRKKK